MAKRSNEGDNTGIRVLDHRYFRSKRARAAHDVIHEESRCFTDIASRNLLEAGIPFKCSSLSHCTYSFLVLSEGIMS